MKRKIAFVTLAVFLALLLVLPVQAETETWSETDNLDVDDAGDAGDDAIKVKAQIKGEKDVWQGGTFEYSAKFYIKEWNDDILGGKSWVKLNELTAWYELDDEDYDIDFDYGPKFNDQKNKEEGTIEEGTFEITFPETSEDQTVDITFWWDYDWKYEYNGIERESGVNMEEVSLKVTARLVLAEINNPEYVGETESPADSEGGFCLGTVLIALIPVSAAAFTVGVKKLKRR